VIATISPPETRETPVAGTEAVGRRRVRPTGVRRQWRVAVASILAAITLAVGGTFFSYFQVVTHYRTAAGQLEQAISLSSKLQDSISAHEAIAHSLWNGASVDLPLYHQQEADIVGQFKEGQATVRSAPQRTLLAQTEATWRQVYTSRGLFGPSAGAQPGVTLAKEQQFGSDSDQVTAALGNFRDLAIAGGRTDIAAANSLQQLLIGLLVSLFALVLGVTIYLARRMTTDILRPVEALRTAVGSLRNGNLDDRVTLPSGHRPNELSELADAFNAMAGALDVSHRDLTHQATHDALTGLANRRAFEAALERQLRRGDRRKAAGLAVLFIDVDDFKDVNNVLGHAGGDIVLANLAGRLSACVREGDLVARLGGDEFAVLLAGGDNAVDVAEATAQRILDSLTAPFIISGLHVPVAVSIGISVGQPASSDADELLSQADFAMYSAKGRGKGRLELFDVVAHDRALARNDELGARKGAPSAAPVG
jgi:diguanylate cyclase (GGDEF)-like protein